MLRITSLSARKLFSFASSLAPKTRLPFRGLILTRQQIENLAVKSVRKEGKIQAVSLDTDPMETQHSLKRETKNICTSAAIMRTLPQTGTAQTQQ